MLVDVFGYRSSNRESDLRIDVSDAARFPTILMSVCLE